MSPRTRKRRVWDRASGCGTAGSGGRLLVNRTQAGSFLWALFHSRSLVAARATHHRVLYATRFALIPSTSVVCATLPVELHFWGHDGGVGRGFFGNLNLELEHGKIG